MRLAPFIHDETHADDKIVSDPSPDRFVHHQTEPAAILQRSPESVGALIGHRRQKLSDEMGAGEGFHPVESALLAAQRGHRVGIDHTLDVVLIHLPGERTMQRLANR